MRTSTFIATVLLCLGLMPRGMGQKLAEPPFVRKWTVRTGDNVVVIAVREGVVYYRGHEGLGAIDLATGERKWRCLAEMSSPAAALQGTNLYALVQTEKKSTLQVINCTSGKARMLASLPLQGGYLCADSERIYVLDNSSKLWAYHPTSGAVLWSRQIAPSKARGWVMAQMRVTPAGIYVGLDEAGEFGVSRKDGAILWHHKTQYAALYPAIVYGNDVITHNETFQRIAMPAGGFVWQKKEGVDDGVLVGKVLVGAGEHNLEGRDVATGNILWHLPLADAGTSYSHMEEHLSISDGESAWLDRDPVVSVTRDGHENWHRSRPFDGSAVYADRETVVTTDTTRILGYSQGMLSPLPTSEPEKQALAQRLASQYEILDDTERKQLDHLVPYAFPLLLARYVEWAKASSGDKVEADGMALYRLLMDVPARLLATCRKEDTEAIVSAWSNLGEKNEYRDTLERLLMAKGDPAGYIPILVKNLRRLPTENRQKSAALTAVSHSSHPEAVAFMLEALRDPKAAPAWRHEAFLHLADTGGQEGIEAVRTARHKKEPRKPWFDQIDPGHLNKRAIEDVRNDARGRTWMLFHSGVLGNYSDLFVVEKVGSTWKRPLFTGLWTGATFGHKAPQTLRGVPVDTLLIRDWIKIFPDDPTLRKDSDGDGLTDLVEARLGTDPNKKDTDGDGLSDLVDPCPNAAPHPLGDTEKILAACMEARFFAEDWGTPAILSAPNVQPFELYGYYGTILWEIPGHKIPLGDLYGGGVNIISFNAPDESARRDEKSFIRYDADHKTAHTMIRRYSGGLNGDGIEVTLRKIGDDWFVVELQTRYVS